MAESKNWKKFPMLFSLYIAQSIPMSFFSTVVPVIMRQENYSLESIGLLQLVRLPWIIKFFWAPLVDNSSRNSKDFKRWIVFSELFYALVIVSIAFLNLQTDFKLIVALIVLSITASATQDIATDAYAILILKKSERGIGNSIQSAGSFVGALISTGILLIAYSFFGWSIFLFLLAAFVLLAIVPLRLYKTPHLIDRSPGYRITIPEIGRFFKIPGITRQVLILIFFNTGFMGVLTMLKPYLVDLGYSLTQIGFMSGIIGTSSAAAFAIVAGFIIRLTGKNVSLLILSIWNIVSAVYFWWISGGDPTTTQIYLGICLLWSGYGSSNVIIYTSSMDVARKGAAGTDFTLQITLTYLSSMIVSISSGKVAGLLGYKGLFGAEIFMGLITVAIVLYSLRGRLKRIK